MSQGDNEQQLFQTLGVIGAGAWGTALANVGCEAGLDTTIWALEDDVVSSINNQHINQLYLSAVKLHSALKASHDMADLAGSDIILLVTPAQHLRSISAQLAKHIRAGVPVLICSKGIEVSTGMLMSQVLAETMPDNPAGILSGPTFAIEVARGMPCAITLAMEDNALGNRLVQALGQATFRPYYSHDIIGAQVGGAIKNVLAVATGILVGLQLGENAKAALITRGLAEINRFGNHYGAETETLMGLSALGDLVLTCGSTQSRNMSLGKALGEGQTMEAIMATRNSVAEGAHTVKIVYKIARDNGISMPICDSVYRIIIDGESVSTVMQNLLARPFKKEVL